MYRFDSLQALPRIPVTSPAGNASQLLGNLTNFQRDVSPVNIGHYDIQPVFDIYADSISETLAAWPPTSAK